MTRALTYRLPLTLLGVFLVLALHAPANAGDPQAPVVLQLADARSEAADRFFLKAVQLYRAGDLTGAAEQFEFGLSINPENPVAHYYYAETLKAMQREAEALAHYEKAAKFGPDTTEGIMAAAVITKLKRKVDAAKAAQDAKTRAQADIADEKACEDWESTPSRRNQGCTAVIVKLSAPPITALKDLAVALWRRASNQALLGKCAAAVKDLVRARNLLLELTKGKPRQDNFDYLTLEDVTIGLTNVLTTSPRRQCRSGKEALRLAAEFPIFRDDKTERHHRALAPIYAEVGQFDRAIQEQEAAIESRKQFFKEVSWSKADMKTVLDSMQQVLEVLRKHKPIRYCKMAEKQFTELCDGID